MNCGSAYINPRPNLASIGTAYEKYFTHERLDDDARSQGILRRLRNGYLNARYGYNLPSALFLGRIVFFFLLRTRLIINRKFRHLPLKKRGAKLLDIGSGNGLFIRDACTAGWMAEGLDLDARASTQCREIGLRVTTGALPNDQYKDASFAAVTMSHSLEHLHDPAMALREVYRILEPGGLVWIAVPNLNSWGHRLFGRCWLALDPPRHLVMFTPSSLTGLLKQVGFTNIRMVRSEFGAKTIFRWSYRITRGEDPLNENLSPLSLFGGFLATLADWWSFFSPESGEEIVLMAERQ
jgi:SAM-dependent methyltransferase